MKALNGLKLGLSLGLGMSAGVAAGTIGYVRGYKDALDERQAFERQRMEGTHAEFVRQIKDVRAEVEDKFTPCDEAIGDSIRWFLYNRDSIIDGFYKECQSNPAYNCNLSVDETKDIYRKLLIELNGTQIFCPTMNWDDEDNVRGAALRDADEYRPGQMAIYPEAFDTGKCQAAGTFAHELAHIATGEDHEEDVYGDDWIYLFGNYVKSRWILERGSCN